MDKTVTTIAHDEWADACWWLNVWLRQQCKKYGLVSVKKKIEKHTGSMTIESEARAEVTPQRLLMNTWGAQSRSHKTPLNRIGTQRIIISERT